MSKFYDKINQKTLKNGLECIIVDIPDKLDCTIYLTVLVGSKNENININGISHFIEHLMYKGNKKYKTGSKLINIINELGAEYNGFTSKDSTSYYFKVYYKNFKPIMELLSFMIFTSLFREKDINVERNVVIQEIQKDLDDPSSVLDDLIYSMVTDDSNPYHKTIAGSSKSLHNCDSKTILDYYHKYYTPDNMKLVIVGNLPNNIEQLINKYFVEGIKEKRKIKEIKSEKEVKRNLQIDKNLLTFKEKFMYDKTDMVSEQLYMAMTFKIFGEDNNKDKYKLDALNTYLNNELTKVLREENALTYNISSFYILYNEFGIFQIIINFDNNKLKKCVELILKVLDKLKKKKINDSIFKKIKENIESSSMINIDDSFILAEFYKDELFYNNSPNKSKSNILKYSEKIDRNLNVSIEEIKELANNIFNFETMKISFVGKCDKKYIKKELSKNKIIKHFI